MRYTTSHIHSAQGHSFSNWSSYQLLFKMQLSGLCLSSTEWESRVQELGIWTLTKHPQVSYVHSNLGHWEMSCKPSCLSKISKPLRKRGYGGECKWQKRSCLSILFLVLILTSGTENTIVSLQSSLCWAWRTVFRKWFWTVDALRCCHSRLAQVTFIAKHLSQTFQLVPFLFSGTSRRKPWKISGSV